MTDSFVILGNVVNLITFIQFIIEVVYWFSGKQSKSIALANNIRRKPLRHFLIAIIKLFPAIISSLLLVIAMYLNGPLSVLFIIAIGFSVSIIISNILFFIISNQMDKLRKSVDSKITMGQAMAIGAMGI